MGTKTGMREIGTASVLLNLSKKAEKGKLDITLRNSNKYKKKNIKKNYNKG